VREHARSRICGKHPAYCVESLELNAISDIHTVCIHTRMYSCELMRAYVTESPQTLHLTERCTFCMLFYECGQYYLSSFFL
jgi:hypothetical protein